jgi:anti-anti-sigma factor
MTRDGSSRHETVGPHLECEVSYRLGAPLISIRGELDHDNAGFLRDAIQQELGEQGEVLILDFTELAFMDSGGLSLMLDTIQRFKGNGWLGVVGAGPGVRRLLQITGLADHPALRIFADLRGLSAGLGAPDKM